jgi:hypothetical protein
VGKAASRAAEDAAAAAAAAAATAAAGGIGSVDPTEVLLALLRSRPVDRETGLHCADVDGLAVHFKVQPLSVVLRSTSR